MHFNFGETGNIIVFVLIITVPLFLIFFFIKWLNKSLTQKAKVKISEHEKNIIGPFLKEKFGDVEYIETEGFDAEKYNELGFFKTKRGYKSWAKLIMDDNLTIYRVKIEYIDTDESATHIFNGYLAETKLEKSFGNKILLKNRWLIDSLIDPQRKTDYLTNNKIFDKKFSVKTGDITLAERLLTPAVQELLTSSKYKPEHSDLLEAHLVPSYNRPRFDVLIQNNFLYVNCQISSYIEYNFLRDTIDDRTLENIGFEIENLIKITNDLRDLINKETSY